MAPRGRVTISQIYLSVSISVLQTDLFIVSCFFRRSFLYPIRVCGWVLNIERRRQRCDGNQSGKGKLCPAKREMWLVNEMRVCTYTVGSWSVQFKWPRTLVCVCESILAGLRPLYVWSMYEEGNVVTWAEAAEESRSKPRYVCQPMWTAMKVLFLCFRLRQSVMHLIGVNLLGLFQCDLWLRVSTHERGRQCCQALRWRWWTSSEQRMKCDWLTKWECVCCSMARVWNLHGRMRWCACAHAHVLACVFASVHECVSVCKYVTCVHVYDRQALASFLSSNTVLCWFLRVFFLVICTVRYPTVR